MMRCEEPTCGAARPTPGAAYIVCVMLSMKLASLPSMFATSFAFSFSDASGNLRILSSAICMHGTTRQAARSISLSNEKNPKKQAAPRDLRTHAVLHQEGFH